MATDKSLRQHYAMQGGGPNYLGKQKMVKAPKKWKSSPDHEPAELAYITKKEKDILLDLNLYGSLKNGKPNRGPSGIISLQGDMGSVGGGGGGGGGGGRDVWDMPAPRPAPRPAPAPARVSPMQSMAMTGNTGLAGKTQAEAQQAVDRGGGPDPVTEIVPGDVISKPKTYTPPTFSPHTDLPQQIKEQEQLNIQQMIAKQQEEKYGPTADPTKFGETISDLDVAMSKNEGDRTIDDKLAIEEYERTIDYDKVKDLADKGHDFKDIQKAIDKGLLTKTDPRKGLLSKGIRSLRNEIPETRLEKSLLGGLKKSFAQTEGGLFDPKKMAFGAARNFALKKLGLGAVVPWLGLLSFLPQLFGKTSYKDMLAKKPAFDTEEANKLRLYADRLPTDEQPTTEKYTKELTASKTPSTLIAKGEGLETKIAKLIKGEKQDTSSIEGQQAVLGKLPLIQFRNLEKKVKAPGIYGKPTEKEKRMYEKLLKMDKEEKVYKMPILTAAHGGRIDKPLMGRSRYL